tara:strand:+ start:160 stop:990 length:831 start_codon:yes stop_codon:yes gene_type:complete
MKVVLGIDAAWTEKEPSGIAVIVHGGFGWRLVVATSSYGAFLANDDTKAVTRHRGSVPEPEAIIRATKAKAGRVPDLIAIDMPLSLEAISGRRAADNHVSSLYGARHAGTHTPSSTRPGKISDELRQGFGEIGYPLATSRVEGRSLVEVYPHPALIELAAADRRLPYKASKVSKYWPDLPPRARRLKLIDTWKAIVGLLEESIEGVDTALPLPAPDARGFEMKAFEDMLDGVVCAWVGACILDDKARAHGDETAAIWIPEPRPRRCNLQGGFSSTS